MKMVNGPRFFEAFGGGWQFKPVDDTTTEAVWRYTFTIRPKRLALVGDPIGEWLLGRDIAARIGVAEALVQTGLGPSAS
jgi:ribosome-associated toxin RatA of RatAB toxin-antitoxin module